MAMAVPSSQQILDVLSHIQDPDLGRDVVSLGMIKELDVSPQGKAASHSSSRLPPARSATASNRRRKTSLATSRA